MPRIREKIVLRLFTTAPVMSLNTGWVLAFGRTLFTDCSPPRGANGCAPPTLYRARKDAFLKGRMTP